MSSKRPIKAFYVPKRNVSQNSSRSLFSPSIHEVQSFDSVLDSSSKIYSQDSFLSNSNLIKENETSQVENHKDRKRCLAILISLFIAACLIGIIVLLAILLRKKGKHSFSLSLLNHINLF